VLSDPDIVDQARVIAAELSRIRLDVTVKPIAFPSLPLKAGTPGEPFDMLLSRYGLDYPDPSNVIIRFLEGANASRRAGNTNFAYFKSALYDKRMAEANRLVGEARTRAFSQLDADLMRNEAPWAPLYDSSIWLFFWTRVGCMKHHLFRIDYSGWCLR